MVSEEGEEQRYQGTETSTPVQSRTTHTQENATPGEMDIEDRPPATGAMEGKQAGKELWTPHSPASPEEGLLDPFSS